jgi:hypothetical protein
MLFSLSVVISETHLNDACHLFFKKFVSFNIATITVTPGFKLFSSLKILNFTDVFYTKSLFELLNHEEDLDW